MIVSGEHGTVFLNTHCILIFHTEIFMLIKYVILEEKIKSIKKKIVLRVKRLHLFFGPF